jgi:hypothetical protein
MPAGGHHVAPDAVLQAEPRDFFVMRAEDVIAFRMTSHVRLPSGARLRRYDGL